MSYTHPALRRYHSDFSTTDRWAGFVNKPNDVFVCTPPKCGTTWTMTIVAMLCQGRTDIIPTDIVHWVDANVVTIEEITKTLEAQNHQRCIKTHSPFDGIPWFKNGHYIAVYRHPIDLLFSVRKHMQNTKVMEEDHPYLAAPEDCMKHFIEAKMDLDDYDDIILESIFTHFKSFLKQPRPDNLLILHYADMLVESRTAIERIAAHIGFPESPEFLDKVLEATAFSNMRANAKQFAPYATRDYWHDPKAFFDSGKSNKWVGVIGEETLVAYKNRMTDFLKPEEIAWLENGSVGSGIDCSSL